jgi:hypothetical protein
MASISGWYKPSKRPERVIIRSGLQYFGEHWLDSLRRSARCMGDSCLLCSIYPVRPVAVVAVQPCRSTFVQLLKLGAGSYEFAACLESLERDLVGVCLRVNRVSEDPADGLEIAIDGEEFARPVPCARYIAAIGRRTYDQAAEVLQSAPPLQIAQ